MVKKITTTNHSHDKQGHCIPLPYLRISHFFRPPSSILCTQPSSNGFTLLECLLALSLSSLIIISLFSLYQNVAQTYFYEKQLTEINENLTWAEHLLSQEISKAGFIGCAQLTSSFPIDYPSKTDTWNIIDSQHEIQIYRALNSGWNPPLPDLLERQALQKNSDIIVVHSMSFETTDILNKSSEYFRLPKDPAYDPNDPVILTNCQGIATPHVHQITRYKDFQEVTFSPTLAKWKLPTHTQIGRFITRAFFVAKTDRKNNAGADVYALYQLDENQRKAELITDIQQLKIRVLAIAPQGGWWELPLKTIEDWNEAQAIQIDIHARSPQPVWQTNQKNYINKPVSIWIPLWEHHA